MELIRKLKTSHFPQKIHKIIKKVYGIDEVDNEKGLAFFELWNGGIFLLEADADGRKTQLGCDGKLSGEGMSGESVWFQIALVFFLKQKSGGGGGVEVW